MKNALLAVVLVITLASISGCVVAVGNTGECGEKKSAGKFQNSATKAEIDAVGRLMSPNAQTRGYRAIAERKHLTERERIYLIKAIDKHVWSPNDKEALLVLLIKNRQFEDPEPETAKELTDIQDQSP